jgi:hypothetical protein
MIATIAIWLFALIIALAASWAISILAGRVWKRRRDHYITDALWWDTFQKRVNGQGP